MEWGIKLMFLPRHLVFMPFNGMKLGERKSGKMIAGVWFAIKKFLHMINIYGQFIYGSKLKKLPKRKHKLKCNLTGAGQDQQRPNIQSEGLRTS